MPKFAVVLKTPAPAKVNIEKLKEDTAALFLSRYVDCNEIDEAANVAVYLTAELTGDEAVFTALVAAHDPALLSAAQVREQKRKQAVTDYASLSQLAGKTDAQIAAFVDANVTDLASAKAAIKFLARAVGALARRGDIEDG